VSGGSLLTLDFSLFLLSFFEGLGSLRPFAFGAGFEPLCSAFNCCS